MPSSSEQNGAPEPNGQLESALATSQLEAMSTRPQDKASRSRARAALVPVATALGLMLLKLVTAVLTGSLAVAASLLDSALDLLASGINLFAIRAADIPPDSDHSWGHGKAEGLSGLVQATAIAASAGALIWQSIDHLMTPKPLFRVDLGVGVLAFSSLASLALTLFLRRAGRRLHSLALSADAAHYMSDVLTNSAAIVALLAYRLFGLSWVDPVASLLIAAMLGKAALGIFRPAIDQLMDRELPAEITARIRRIATDASPHVFGIHELRTRRSGRTVVLDLHVEILASLSFVEAHDVTVRVQHAIEEELGDCIATIHADPYSAPGHPLNDSCSHLSPAP